jgi:hypothetical protein
MRLLRCSTSACLAAVSVLAVLLATGLPAASARIVDRGEIHDTFTRTDMNFCGVQGLTVDVATTVDGRYQVNSRGPDGPEYYMEGIRVVDVYTDRATHLSVTDISPHTLDKDLSVVDNGATLTIVQLLTGGQRTYGHTGKLIARNSGQVRFRIVVDKATGDEISRDLFFGSTGTNDDFCAAVLADWGIA